ncbi:MAG: hypothetical protein D6753_12830, partial [Planctomycetota bacterium]
AEGGQDTDPTDNSELALRLVVVGAVGDQSGFVGCHRIADGEAQWQVRGLEAVPVCVAADGRWIYAGDDAGRVTVYRATDGQQVWSRQVHTKLVTALVVLPGGVIASADWGGKIVLSRQRDGAELHSFQQHRDRVSDLGAWAQQNPLRLFSSGWDGTVRLWYPEQFRLVRFVQLNEPAVGMEVIDGRHIVAANPQGDLLWIDMDSAQVTRAEPSGLSYVHAMLVVPSDRLLVSDGLRHVRSLPVQHHR